MDGDAGAGKGPVARYETATPFAADVQRYLHDEPVAACPPSAWYRLRKLADATGPPRAWPRPSSCCWLSASSPAPGKRFGRPRAEEVANEARQAEYERAADLAVALERTEGAEKAERQRAGELTVALRKVEQAEKAEKARAEELKKQSAIRPSLCLRNLSATGVMATFCWLRMPGTLHNSAELANHHLALIPANSPQLAMGLPQIPQIRRQPVQRFTGMGGSLWRV